MTDLPWFLLTGITPPAAPIGNTSSPIAVTTSTAAPAAMYGGGNLNGSTNQQLLGQAGTAGIRIAQPRASAGNYTGVV